MYNWSYNINLVDKKQLNFLFSNLNLLIWLQIIETDFIWQNWAKFISFKTASCTKKWWFNVSVINNRIINSLINTFYLSVEKYHPKKYSKLIPNKKTEFSTKTYESQIKVLKSKKHIVRWREEREEISWKLTEVLNKYELMQIT